MSLEELLPTGDTRTLAGVFDGLNRLWTLYWMAYVHGEGKSNDSSGVECPFCVAPTKSDEEGLIVYQGRSRFVIMSLFPYDSDYLLVCPYRHVSYCADLSEEEYTEFGELTAQTMLIEKETAQPQGFNTGMNQDEVAGTGITVHLHQYTVPRWLGDVNFLPIIAGAKAVPEPPEDVRSRLIVAWPKGK